MHITFEQFRAASTRILWADYMAREGYKDAACCFDESTGYPVAIRDYLGLWIAELPEGKFHLVLIDHDWTSDDLGELERKLYEFCEDEDLLPGARFFEMEKWQW
jgi:hypothetical protein